MKTYLALSSLAALSIVSQVAHADFNAELSGQVFKGDDVKLYALGGSYYFQRVDTSKGPLAEASFLDKQNSVDAIFSHIDGDSGNANTRYVGGSYMIDNSPLYLTAAVAHINGYSADTYQFGGGYFLRKDWSVSLNTEFNDDLDYQGLEVSSKRLFSLGNDQFFALQGSYTNPDDGDDIIAVGGDFYFNRMFSAGLGYAWSDGFTDGVSTLRSQWFINDRMAVNGQIAYDDSDSDSNTSYLIGGTMRF